MDQKTVDPKKGGDSGHPTLLRCGTPTPHGLIGACRPLLLPPVDCDPWGGPHFGPRGLSLPDPRPSPVWSPLPPVLPLARHDGRARDLRGRAATSAVCLSICMSVSAAASVNERVSLSRSRKNKEGSKQSHTR